MTPRQAATKLKGFQIRLRDINFAMQRLQNDLEDMVKDVEDNMIKMVKGGKDGGVQTQTEDQR